MSTLITIGHAVTFPTLRDYIMSHRIDAGDSIVVHPNDYENLVREVKQSESGLAGLPIEVLGVLITHDGADTVPIGKIQVIKNERL